MCVVIIIQIHNVKTLFWFQQILDWIKKTKSKWFLRVFAICVCSFFLFVVSSSQIWFYISVIAIVVGSVYMNFIQLKTS